MARFISRYAGLRITMELDKLENGKFKPARYIQFSGGEYVTKKDDEAAFLRNHPDCGGDFFEEPEAKKGGK